MFQKVKYVNCNRTYCNTKNPMLGGRRSRMLIVTMFEKVKKYANCSKYFDVYLKNQKTKKKQRFGLYYFQLYSSELVF